MPIRPFSVSSPPPAAGAGLQSQFRYDALPSTIGVDRVSPNYLKDAEHGDKQFVAPANLDLVIGFLDKYLK